MRYESFYPFSHHPTQPMSQQRVMQNTFAPPREPQSNPGQQFESLSNHIPGGEGGQGRQGPSKLDNYMQTADRFLTTAQQFAPLIQQFAPMISNLPSMWRLYKGFQSMPDRSPTGENTRSTTATAQNFSRPRSTSQGFEPTTPRPSMPKIFQPPNP